MPPKKKQEKGKKEFMWTDDESELLLNVVHEYKVQQLLEGTCWESVKTKYADILQLFCKELPENEEQARSLRKDYPHKAVELSKEILTTKLKAVRLKFREVCSENLLQLCYTQFNTVLLALGS